MEEKILQKRINNYSKTIQIMDDFDGIGGKNKPIYDSLELTDVFYIVYRNNYYCVSLVIKRKPSNIEFIDSSLTFTDFKKNLLGKFFRIKDKASFKVLYEVFEGLKNQWNFKDESTYYKFPIPVLFNAQNSLNRSGYGSIYRWGELIQEGTYYGDTTDYIFVGAKYRRW